MNFKLAEYPANSFVITNRTAAHITWTTNDIALTGWMTNDNRGHIFSLNLQLGARNSTTSAVRPWIEIRGF